MILDASLKTSQKVILYQTLHFETSKKITFALMVMVLLFSVLQYFVIACFQGQYRRSLYIFQDDNILRRQYCPHLCRHYAYQYLRYGEQYCDFIPPSPAAAISEFPSGSHFLTHRHPILKRFEPENENYISVLATFNIKYSISSLE